MHGFLPTFRHTIVSVHQDDERVMNFHLYPSHSNSLTLFGEYPVCSLLSREAFPSFKSDDPQSMYLLIPDIKRMNPSTCVKVTHSLKNTI